MTVSKHASFLLISVYTTNNLKRYKKRKGLKVTSGINLASINWINNIYKLEGIYEKLKHIWRFYFWVSRSASGQLTSLWSCSLSIFSIVWTMELSLKSSSLKQCNSSICKWNERRWKSLSFAVFRNTYFLFSFIGCIVLFILISFLFHCYLYSIYSDAGI